MGGVAAAIANYSVLYTPDGCMWLLCCSYNKKLLSRGRFAELLAADNRPFNDEEFALFDKSAEFAYESFRNKAAESRNMSIDDMQVLGLWQSGIGWSCSSRASCCRCILFSCHHVCNVILFTACLQKSFTHQTLQEGWEIMLCGCWTPAQWTAAQLSHLTGWLQHVITTSQLLNIFVLHLVHRL